MSQKKTHSEKYLVNYRNAKFIKNRQKIKITQNLSKCGEDKKLPKIHLNSVNFNYLNPKIC